MSRDSRLTNSRKPVPAEAGISTVEFVLTALLFLMFLFGIVDFGRVMFEWNSAAKATHWGARYAALHAMVAPGLSTLDTTTLLAGNGLPVPLAQISPNPVTCTNTSCDGYGYDGAAFNAIVAQMQRIYSRIQPGNVVVEYQHIGLGFAGNPHGPDIVPAVTVRLRDMKITLVTPLLAGLVELALPPFRTTMTGEDLANSPT